MIALDYIRVKQSFENFNSTYGVTNFQKSQMTKATLLANQETKLAKRIQKSQT